MKLRKVVVHPRRRALELVARSGESFLYPFSRLDPRPTSKDPIREARVDPELAREGVTYRLQSGREGTVLADQALDYNSDPVYVTGLLLHRLTLEAKDAMARTGLSVREVARVLRTSVPQVYRLTDPGNTRKNLAQLLALLQVLDCEVEVVVRHRGKGAAAKAGAQRRRAA